MSNRKCTDCVIHQDCQLMDTVEMLEDSLFALARREMYSETMITTRDLVAKRVKNCLFHKTIEDENV